ncbi:MAG: hypothetical protein L6Q40_05760, partial [Azonexus sp.]|nr:hypothetical protein [Azonexus sp.]
RATDHLINEFFGNARQRRHLFLPARLDWHTCSLLTCYASHTKFLTGSAPFVVPHGWKWARIADIGYDFGQKTPDADFTYIDVGSIDNRLGLIDCPATLRAEDAPSRARKLVSRGTVIYSTVRPYLLNVAIVQKDFDPEPIASTAFAVVHPFEGVVSGYVYRYLRSPSFVAYVESVQTGIAYPAINDRQFFSGLIPLPPTAEQHRIVAKVEELMALCDQLEQQTDASLGAHQSLVETLLSALTSAADHAQFVSAWQRIASHFDTLFTTEESIAQLKQTLLQLAVMGKLVPQDPNDEPASELLKKIAAEKAKLAKEGRIKKEKPLPLVGEDETLFSLPLGWAWCRLENVSLHSEAGWSPKCEEVPRVGSCWGVLKVSAVTWGVFNPAENKALPANLDAVPDCEVKPGDFLISRANTAELVARSVVVQNDAPPRLMMSDKIIRFSFSKEVCAAYLSLFNNSAGSRKYYLRVAGGTSSSMKNVSRLQIQSLAVALPPLAEQYRIVTKVDELMALCDQLKSHLNDAQTTQLHLADALVEQAIG